MRFKDDFSEAMEEALACLENTRDDLNYLEEALKDLTRAAGYYVEKHYDVFDLSDTPNDNSLEAEK